MSATSPGTIVQKAVGWSIGLSVLMIVAGILAIASPLVAGIAVNVLIAWLLVFSGCIHLVFSWSTRTTGGFLWELLVGIVYIFIGVYLLMHPVAALMSLTIALAIYLTLEAGLEFALGFKLRPLPGSGWLLFDGIITLILAVMIWRTWPSSSAWVIGTLVGISMLFSGTSRLMLSLAARSVTSQAACSVCAPKQAQASRGVPRAQRAASVAVNRAPSAAVQMPPTTYVAGTSTSTATIASITARAADEPAASRRGTCGPSMTSASRCRSLASADQAKVAATASRRTQGIMAPPGPGGRAGDAGRSRRDGSRSQ